MNHKLPDAVAILLYSKIIFPWETGLKSAKGCWDVNRTRALLVDTDIDLKCVSAGEVEVEISKRTSRSPRNFVYFLSSASQMQDLFRHLRNCAAHASIRVESPPSKGGPRLVFSGIQQRKIHLAVSGDLELGVMSSLVATLATSPAASE